MKTNQRPQARRDAGKAGVTMIDLLMTVAVLSAIASVAYISVANVHSSTVQFKLRSDVASLNAALQVYQANGGSLDGVSDVQGVLDVLKTTTSGDNRKQIAGIRGTMVDLRVAAKEVEGAEGLTAVWDDGSKRFRLQAGGDGIVKFYLDDNANATPAVETRAPRLKLAVNDNWVWDYKDVSTSGRIMNEADSTDPESEPDAAPVATAMAMLVPPRYSHYEGAYPLMDYPLHVTLTNENPSGSSAIFYTLDGERWKKYIGAPIIIYPEESIRAFTGTLDPEQFSDSEQTEESYYPVPLELELAIASEKSSYNYFELGGEIMDPTGGGISPAYPSANPVEVSIANAGEIPFFLADSANFNIRWTNDGTDPLTNGGAVEGLPFVGSIPDTLIPIEVDNFGSSPVLPIRAVAPSTHPYFVNSAEVGLNLEIEKLELRAPVASIGYESRSEISVVLDLDASFGDVPKGARVFYTLDGSDPGDGNDPFATALEYTGPFTVTSNAVLVVRTYAPVDYLDWFIPSVAFTQELVIPDPPRHYVGGKFERVSTGSHRNIARLDSGGQLDSSFYPGSGASKGSIVGAMVVGKAGGVYAGGDFESMNGFRRFGVARLNDNGSVDTSFNAELR